MKKIISAAVIWAALLAVPFVILNYKRTEVPQNSQVPQIVEPVKPTEPEEKPAEIVPTQPVTPVPSSTFMKGYWDGWHGIWLGPIRWILSDDYRQGHMLGSHDRSHHIERYTPDQR